MRRSLVRQRLLALISKEFVQIRRDRRTLAMMIFIPVIWLTVFGYAATFDVRHIRVAVGGGEDVPLSRQLASVLDRSEYFDVVETSLDSPEELEEAIREGQVSVAVLPPREGEKAVFLADGSDLFTAQTAARQLQVLAGQLQRQTGAPGFSFETRILYNPDLRSANYMIPGLVGVVMVFIATIMTALGVVRERERGTLEQLMVTPLRPVELMLGKILPYLLIASLDLVIVVAVGVFVFDVPFAGNAFLLFGLSFLFLFVSLGIGLLVSTVSQTQQQALQLAVFTLLPQILLSGFIFPLEAIPWGVRWVSYLAPLTYFLPIARGIFVKDLGFGHLWPYTAVLAGYAGVVLAAASLQFRRRLL